MREILNKLNRIFNITCYIAFFINIILLVFSSVYLDDPAAFELQILSLFNMLLLSFVLLREPNPKT